ncbi:thioredoxin, partial [Escherichia coli]|nr:thioredoxin [Escherichia coli]
MRHATEQDFDDIVLKNDKPVLVDFWAPWCAPCKALAPTLDEMAEEYADEMEIVKVDIEANPKLAERFGVRGIPLLMIVKDGAETARTFGTVCRSPRDALVDANGGKAGWR